MYIRDVTCCHAESTGDRFGDLALYQVQFVGYCNQTPGFGCCLGLVQVSILNLCTIGEPQYCYNVEQLLCSSCR